MNAHGTLTHLRDLGNTVIVVEHDEDHPRVGSHDRHGPGGGGARRKDRRLRHARRIFSTEQAITDGAIHVRRCALERMPRRNALQAQWPSHCHQAARSTTTCKNIDVEIPLGLLHLRHRCVRFRQVESDHGDAVSHRRHTTQPCTTSDTCAAGKAREDRRGWNMIDKVIDIDQIADRAHAAIKSGDVHRNVYTGARSVRAARSRARGYEPGRFSFNVKGGRCEACEGNGADHD
jgi:excinuclease ABC subunit A